MIYLDNAFETPIDPEVIQEMLPYWRIPGDPDQNYLSGKQVRHFIDEALNDMTCIFSGANGPENIVFTNGSYHAMELVIRGLANSGDDEDGNAPGEHGSILIDSSLMEERKMGMVLYDIKKRDLYKHAFEITPFYYGMVCFDTLKAELHCSKPYLVVVPMVNKYTGSVNNIPEIAELVHKYGAYLLVDCSAAAISQKIEPEKMGIDFAAIDGSLIGGPAGIGALYVKDKTLLSTLSDHPHPETAYGFAWECSANLPMAKGLAKACKKNYPMYQEDADRENALRRNAFLDGLYKFLGPEDIRINTHSSSLTNILSITIHDVDAKELQEMLAKKVAFTAGEYSEGNGMGGFNAIEMTEISAKETIRISHAPSTSIEDMEAAGRMIGRAAFTLRKPTPVGESDLRSLSPVTESESEDRHFRNIEREVAQWNQEKHVSASNSPRGSSCSRNHSMPAQRVKPLETHGRKYADWNPSQVEDQDVQFTEIEEFEEERRYEEGVFSEREAQFEDEDFEDEEEYDEDEDFEDEEEYDEDDEEFSDEAEEELKKIPDPQQRKLVRSLIRFGSNLASVITPVRDILFKAIDRIDEMNARFIPDEGGLVQIRLTSNRGMHIVNRQLYDEIHDQAVHYYAQGNEFGQTLMDFCLPLDAFGPYCEAYDSANGLDSDDISRDDLPF